MKGLKEGENMRASLKCFGFLSFCLLVLFVFMDVGRAGSGATARKSEPRIVQSLLAFAQDEVWPDRIVIKFKPGAGGPQTLSAAGSSGLSGLMQTLGIYKLEPVLKGAPRLYKATTSVGLDRVYYARFSPGQSPIAVAMAVAQDPAVEYAEPLHLYRIEDTPNDPLFGEQVFHSIIKSTAAWDVVKGEQGSVVIAVVDGGTNINHEDIAANLWVNTDEIPDNGIDDDNNGFVDDVHGWNFANDSNDPSGLSATPTNANHGTHVAGIADAVANNGVGVAGVAFNAMLMPIDAGHPTQDNVIGAGFAGIIYAANNGADVINTSWGGAGAPSQFEQDVVTMAADMGAVVVASAGNSGNSVIHYPSGYPTVLSVASVSNFDQRSNFSSFGTTVDLAAPGENIRSSFNGNGIYGFFSGTSQAAPVVTGTVALVKTQHPDWSGVQAAEQVRVTADNIDDQNPSLAGQLGRGRVNALRAVTETSPSVRISKVSFTENNNDGVIQPGESVQLTLTLINYLEPVNNLDVTLTEDDPFVTLVTSSDAIASLGTLQEQTVNFAFDVASTAPSGRPLDFAVEVSNGSYQDVDRFTLVVQPTFGNADINNVTVSLTNLGRIGFADPNNQLGGIGFRFKNSESLLFEGAIIAGTGPTQLSNAARSQFVGGTLLFDQDFSGANGGDLRIITPGVLSDQESFAAFVDDKSNTPMNLRITQESFASSSPPNDDFVLIRYTIENLGDRLDNFHFGLFMDWDIPTNSPDPMAAVDNIAVYDSQRRLGVVSFGNTFVGTALMTEGTVNYRGISNPDPTFGVFDGFTDDEKWEAISGGIQGVSQGPVDVSHVLAAGPFTIESDQHIQVGFALVAGESLQDLQQNTDAAKEFWDSIFTTDVKDEPPPGVPTRFALQQNYPNPFNPTTTIRYQVPQAANVRIVIYNLLGQRVRTLVDERKPAGTYSVQWNGRDDSGRTVASGVYLYRLVSGKFRQTQKMLLLK
ncbi:MAG: T9SS C-terminal target domain-containing protein [Calditrichaeota bacterium]|nr:MAG: T9SS C-terminal target domain-containing protein [Calditrichota bacterium]